MLVEDVATAAGTRVDDDGFGAIISVEILADRWLEDEANAEVGSCGTTGKGSTEVVTPGSVDSKVGESDTDISGTGSFGATDAGVEVGNVVAEELAATDTDV